MKNYFIVGGAGFIGSHLVKTLFKEESELNVTIFDNFSSGRMWHLDEVKDNKNLKIIKGDIKDKDFLVESMKGSDVVYHFASNPDISKAVTQPDIDFWEGTYLTNNVIDAMRINEVKKLIYASGSGVYGDTGELVVEEDYSPMLPISTYGASKLSCEALICSYCYMFDITASAFRFANVVGPHQTHGVGYDFVKRLLDNPTELSILGDGTQSKSYIYVTDVISAIRILEKNAPEGFSYYNVATLDYITVNEIADIAVEVVGLKDVKYIYSGGKRGWKGDVPVIRLNSEKIRKLGWSNKYNSKEAIYNSIKSMYEDALNKKL
jgi:UDP-glucose 4-epimerase